MPAHVVFRVEFRGNQNFIVDRLNDYSHDDETNSSMIKNVEITKHDENYFTISFDTSMTKGETKH